MRLIIILIDIEKNQLIVLQNVMEFGIIIKLINNNIEYVIKHKQHVHQRNHLYQNQIHHMIIYQI